MEGRKEGRRRGGEEGRGKGEKGGRREGKGGKGQKGGGRGGGKEEEGEKGRRGVLYGHKFPSSSQVYPVAMATYSYPSLPYMDTLLLQVPASQGTTLHNLPFTPTSPGLMNSVEQQLMPRYSVGMSSAFEEQSYHIMTRSHASQVCVRVCVMVWK